MAPGIFGLVFVAMGAVSTNLMVANQMLAAVVSSGNTSSVVNAELAFHPSERAVTNWRREAANNLDLSSDFKTKLIEGSDVPEVPRCVRLNNYWCIKRAGWAGEIAADAEGHVAFASALDGAVAAAILMRRYYRDYNRHSASAILSRWAPARCTNMIGLSPVRKQHLAQQNTLRGIAPLGIQNTLRARWLASHRQGVSGHSKAMAHTSIIPSRPLSLMRAPEIAVGMGETERAPIRIAALELPVSAPLGGASCLGEGERLRNYTLRAIEGIAPSPEDDLNLFSADGTPGANLAHLLENMAKVEIGPLGAQAGLIGAAIERVMTQDRAARMPAVENHPSDAANAAPRQAE
jgi:hypothetical protein